MCEKYNKVLFEAQNSVLYYYYNNFDKKKLKI